MYSCVQNNRNALHLKQNSKLTKIKKKISNYFDIKFIYNFLLFNYLVNAKKQNIFHVDKAFFQN